MCKGIDFDFSLLNAFGDPQIWAVNVMTNPYKNALFYSKLSTKQGEGYDNVLESLVECILENLPNNSFETQGEIYKRGQ